MELHESLWSWKLFKAQLLSLFQAVWNRLLRKKKKVVEEPLSEEPLSGAAPIRTIREIYRAFLKWASQRGLPRKRYETPEEFRQRLLKQYPQHSHELQELTAAYASIRYGGLVPDERTLEQVRRDWEMLQQNA